MYSRIHPERLLYSVNGAAEALGTTTEKIEMLISEGTIKCVVIEGLKRIHRDDIYKHAKIKMRVMPDKILLSIADTAYVLSISKAKLYQLINEGVFQKAKLFGA